MYQFRLSTEADAQLGNLSNRAAIPGVLKALQSLEKDPFKYKNLKHTSKKVLGEFYVNVNWYAITLNIDEQNQLVDILLIVPKSKLHKLKKM